MNNVKTESDSERSEDCLKSDTPSDSRGDKALSDEASRVLRWIDSRDPSQVSIRSISSSTGLSKYKARKSIEELSSKSCIDISGPNNSREYSVSNIGVIVLENIGGDACLISDSNQSGTDIGETDIQARVHKLSYILELSDDNMIRWDDKESVLSEFGDILEAFEDSKEFRFSKDAFRVRITGERVIVYLREDKKGLDISALKSEGFDEILDLREWMSENLKLNFEDRSLIDVQLSTQHIALENHPVAVLIDEASDVSISSIDPVRDEKGRVRIWIDESEGREIETGTRGEKSGLPELSEDDADEMLSNLLVEVQNKKGRRVLNDLIRAFDDHPDLFRDYFSGQDSESRSSFEYGESGEIEVDKQASVSERCRVNVCEFSKDVEVSQSIEGEASERSKNHMSERPESSVMTVSENSEALDVRNLPDQSFVDETGRVWTVWFISNVDVGPEDDEDESERPVVTLKSRDERVDMPLEDLKKGVIEGEIERVES